MAFMFHSESSKLRWRWNGRRNRSGRKRIGTMVCVAGLALALLASPSAHAQNLISDPSFETTQLGQGGYEYPNTTLNNWVYTGYAVLINGGAGSPWTDGTQTGYDGNQWAGVQINGTLAQTFAAPNSGLFDVTWLDNARPGNTQNYTVSVVDDTTNTVVASKTLTVSSSSTFNLESMTSNLVAGDTYTLTFQGVDTAVSPGADETAFIDDVTLNGGPAPTIGGLLPSVPIIAVFAWLYRRRMRAEA